MSFTGCRKLPASRRARLTVLVLAAIGPLAAFVAYQIHEIGERRVHEAMQRAQDYARIGADRFEDVIGQARIMLELVSKVDQVTRGTAQECEEFLNALARARQWASGLWVIGQDGRVRCATAAKAIGLDLSQRDAYRHALAAGGFSVSGFFIGGVTHRPLVVATLPARNPFTAETMLLAVTLELTWFDKLAADIGERTDATILLVDGSGTRIAEFPSSPGLVGANLAAPSVVDAILAQSHGQLEGLDADGQPAFFGFVALSGTDLHLVVIFARDRVLARVNQGIVYAITVFGFVVLLAAGLIWIAGNRIFGFPLHELDELLQVTLDHMDQGLIVDDKHARVPICNRRALELLDLPEALMKSRPSVEALIAFQKRRKETAGSHDDIGAHPRAISGAMSIYERERPNGTVLEIRVVPLADGGVVRTYTDVTARKRAEADRDRTRALLDMVVENVPSTIAVKDPRDFRYILINRAGERYYGISREAMIGRTAHDFLPKASADLVTKLDRQVLEAHPRSILDEHAIAMPGGETRIGASIRTCLLASDGQPQYLLAVIDDITERKSLQSELEQAKLKAEEASRAKGEFLAAMTHEIRTPLSSIIGFTDLLLASQDMSATQRRHVGLIQNAGTALLTVVNDILDVSKIEAGQIDLRQGRFAPASFVEGSVEIVRHLADAKGLSLAVELDPKVPDVLVGDEDRLRQVLLNLVNNAVKFTHAGRITVRLRHLGTSPAGDRIRLEVEDTGIGIPEDKLDRLFKRFSQADGSIAREFGGTGLGLSISKKLVQLMGGSIGVTSRAGEGSTFWFEVSLRHAEAGALAAATMQRTVSASNAAVTLLVVDDVEANLEITGAMLRQAGYQVDTVRDGASAIEAVRAGGYDIVLMDVQMSGMDGLTATRAIRALPSGASSIPIIAMTANVYTDQVTAFLAAGMNDHIAKPFRSPELLAAVDKWAAVGTKRHRARDRARDRASDPSRHRGIDPGSDPTGDPDRVPKEALLAPAMPEAATLDQLTRLLGAERLAELLAEFQEHLSGKFQCQHADPEGLAVLRQEAHAMIAQAGMLGFAELSQSCRTLQDALHSGRDVAAALAELSAEQARALAALCTLTRQQLRGKSMARASANPPR